MYLRILILAAALLAAACDGDKRPVVIVDDGTGGSGGAGGSGGGGVTWTFRTLDGAPDGADNTGYQPELRVAPNGRLAAAWFRSTGRTGVCQLPQRDPAPTDTWEIVYGVEQGDSFAQEVVAEIELVGRPTGVSLAFDAAGTPMVAFMGMGATGEFRCGATNTVLARRSASGWTQQVIDTDGNVPEMIFPEDVPHCANYQNACNLGELVGMWPALGVADGQPVLAYRDGHYAFGVDAEEKSDLQLWWQGRKVTAEAVSGGGSNTRLVVDDAQGIHIAHYNDQHRIGATDEYTDGIWLIHYENGGWMRERVVPVRPIAERIGLAAVDDRLGLAWHEPKEGRVRYVERKAGAWAQAEVVDAKGRTGLSPSLAFDPDGRPAIAYQRCSAAGQQGADCQASEDSLRFAIKDGKSWITSTIRSDPGKQEGLYTSLVFDSEGRPAVAFQEQVFDAIDQVVRRRLVLARGETL
ncbi:hypothetical protein [Vulgatibacter incomptus]|uniref:Lipoprotein n=1 Tax=Vulgatibacter incomptus TaxID=1391653 RepID=A0A0K1PF07_9BACT|nr:hypothetical protein [Vulgatibacter incomptus]AKU92113.1 hypothetical protein AKJ08_2500 [Vulgatibacter incomptus]